MRKGQFLSKTSKDMKKDHAAKLLNKLKRTCFDFSQMRQFLLELKGELTTQTLPSSVSIRCTDIEESQTSNALHGV